MNINMSGNGGFFANSLSLGGGSGLKSAEAKQQRQAKCRSQVDYWEKKKESLKNMECDTVEEIAEKLELYHSYEDSIAAAKKAYNSEQQWHMLDEARERGEKIAEAAKKNAPKTEEERKEELREEAAGETEGGSGLLEVLDAIPEIEEMTEELTEELLPEELQETRNEELPSDGLPETLPEELSAITEQAAQVSQGKAGVERVHINYTV